MDPRKQALRQFGAFLANVCAGELGIRTLDGGAVSLDPGTEVTVGGSQTTLGDLAHSIDAHLVALQSVSIDGPGVRDDYGRIADLLGGFDDGIGISVSCGSGSPALAGAQLLTAQPNPFRATTTIGYTVATTGAATIGVYDLSGRLVRRITAGVESSGSHSFTWDGTDDSGARVHTGVYFVRGRIGAQPVRAQLLVLR